MTHDIATRVYNHNWKLDPIVRSLMDTDFYKFTMGALIYAKHRDVSADFKLVNRKTAVRIADDVSEEELREQLDHARTLRFSKNELIWLQGNTFYGRERMFPPEYIAWLAEFRLPDYELRKVDGQFDLTFSGPWAETSMWEIPALSIVNELRSRASMRQMGRLQLDVLYSRAKAKLWEKIERLRPLHEQGSFKISEFGTRRRHGFLWQKWCLQALCAGLGNSVVGTSNVLLAMTENLEASGTNAHELATAYVALAAARSGGDPQAMRDARYEVGADWQKMYGGNLLVHLPDAFGTTSFLRDAPAWAGKWTGVRPDSKDPIIGGDEVIDWFKARGEDPSKKLLILADGMDVDSILKTHAHFDGRIRVGYGWGTNLTNDFRGCSPLGGQSLDPISLVCKVVRVNGQGAVKLSDNPSKAVGDRKDIEFYLKVFGTDGMTPLAVEV